MEAKKTSTFVLLALVVMLGGCTTNTTAPLNNTEPTKAHTPSSEADKNSNAKTAPPTNHLPPSAPCVYESTKGVAEVIEVSPEQVTFKFYPGDQVFTLPAEALNNVNISLDQELKAIIRTPLSGPCEETEFELLSTVE